MMGECRECRWWTVEPEDAEGPLGACELTRCPETQPVPYPRVAFADVPSLSVNDDEVEDIVLPAVLITVATFGCNQFAPKEPA